MLEQFQSICRICLKPGEFISIFDYASSSSQQIQIDKIITECTQIEIQENDEFPKTICGKCVEQFKIAYNIIVLCRESDFKLKEKLNDNKSYDENAALDEFPDSLKDDTHEIEIIFPEQQNFALEENVKDEYDETPVNDAEHVDIDEIGDEEEDEEIQDEPVSMGITKKSLRSETIAEESDVNMTESEEEKSVDDEEEDEDNEEEVGDEEEEEEEEDDVEEEEDDDDDENEDEDDDDSDVSSEYEAKKRKTEKRIHDCKLCGMCFKNDNFLTKHTQSFSHNDQLPFDCKACSIKLTTEKELDEHIKFHNKDGTLTVAAEKPKLPIYGCKLCGECFKNKNLYFKHLQIESHLTMLPFDCKTCAIRLVTDKELSEHIKFHKKDISQYVCEFCGKGFKNESVLNYHKWTHTKEKVFPCHVCLREFVRNSSLKRHMLTHTGERPYDCKVCGKTFTQSYVLTKHMQQNHTELTPYSCDKCDSRFALVTQLNAHKQKHLENKLSDDKNIYSCKVCGIRFRNKNFIYKHLSVEAHVVLLPFDCKTCNIRIANRPELEEHIREHKKEFAQDFVCEFCGRGFKNESVLACHKLIHTKEKTFKCDECDKEFVRKSTLKRHILTHTGEKPFVCKICKKSFTQSYVLTKHMRIHTGETPYHCDFEGCKRVFVSLPNLSAHKTTHIENNLAVDGNDAKPFKCSFCQKGFFTKFKWARHEKSHASNLSLQCCYCGKKFSKPESLRYHEKRHSASDKYDLYKCDLCDKEFLRKQSLARHHRMQSCQKPSKYDSMDKKYKCDLCNKSFSKPSILNDHKISHSDIQPYECTICNKKFKRSRTFAYHKKSHATYDGTININEPPIHPPVLSEHQLDSTMCVSIYHDNISGT